MPGHLDNVESLLSPGAITKLRELIDRGYKTAQEFMDPAPVVSVARQPKGGGPPVHVGTFTAILIQWGVREVTDTSMGPVVTSSSSGQMRHEEGEFSLQIGDIITYAGRSARVASVNPPSFGVVVSDLELTQ